MSCLLWVNRNAFGCLWALTFFILAFGVHTLNPEYIDWLLQSHQQDSIQHFVGWEFFRFEPWHFPLGVIRNYGYPIPTSVVYTDSIPLLALVFKCFSTILPANFQYFGFWFIACFMLQGFFAQALSEKITPKKSIQACMVLFFVLSPIMLNRMVEHQALVAHWVILAGFNLYVSPYSLRTDRNWFLLSAVTLLIHAYLAVMVFALWGAYLIRLAVIEKKVTGMGVLLRVSLPVIPLILLAYLAGYFVIPFGSSADSIDHQLYAMNLISPFVPTRGALTIAGHWSRFISPFETRFLEQAEEGFDYFGLGFLLLLFLGVGLGIRQRIIRKSLWPLIMVCIVMAFYALSNTIYFGDKILFSYHFPDFLSSITHLFRARGRFFWPLYYLLMLYTFKVICERLNERILMALLLTALVIQWLDLSDKINEIQKQFTVTHLIDGPSNVLHSTHMSALYHHIVFLPRILNPSREIKGFGDYIHYAAQHHLTVNQGYFARHDARLLNQLNKEQERLAYRGRFAPDTLYVVLNRPMASRLNVLLGKNGYTERGHTAMVIYPDPLFKIKLSPGLK